MVRRRRATLEVIDEIKKRLKNFRLNPNYTLVSLVLPFGGLDLEKPAHMNL